MSFRKCTGIRCLVLPQTQYHPRSSSHVNLGRTASVRDPIDLERDRVRKECEKSASRWQDLDLSTLRKYGEVEAVERYVQ